MFRKWTSKTAPGMLEPTVSPGRNDVQALNPTLNGTSVSNLKESFKGIFVTNMMENKIAFGTSQQPGYLLDSLKEMEAFMFEQGVIQQHLDLQDLMYFDGIQRFFSK